MKPVATELTRHRLPLRALTGVRFCAAGYVVIFHSPVTVLLVARNQVVASNFTNNGYLAVPLFFVLSGFILAYTYHGQIGKRGSYRRFWEARFARIWPVYAVSLLLASLPPCHGQPRPGVMLATLLMLQAWNPFDIAMAGAWNFVCWTLSVEALFYLVFPWVQVWLEKRTSRVQLGWVALMLLTCVIVNSGTRTLGYKPTGTGPHVPLPVFHLSEFLTGVGMGNYFLRRLAVRTLHRGAPLRAGRGIWTYLSALAAVALLCHPTWRWTSLVVAAYAALVFGLASEETLLSRLLSTRAMVFGGGISYSLYLMQIIVKVWGLALDTRFHFGIAVRWPLNGIILVVISVVLFTAVEEPARKYLRSLFAAIEDRRNVMSVRRSGPADQGE